MQKGMLEIYLAGVGHIYFKNNSGTYFKRLAQFQSSTDWRQINSVPIVS